MINFKASIKNFISEIKLNRCGVILITTSIGLTSTGCVDMVVEDLDCSSKEESDTYYVLTDVSSDITTSVDTTITTSVKTTTIPTSVVTSADTTTNSVSTEFTTDLTEPTLSLGDYSVSEGYAKYEVCFDDTLESLSLMNGSSIDEIKRINQVDSVNEGDIIILKADLVKFFINDSKSVSEISDLTGIDIDEICKLNEVPNDFIFRENNSVIVKALFFNEDYYDTRLGRANIINNNIIFGDKVIKKDNNYLVLKSDLHLFGVNDVSLYTFDDSNYICKELFCNVRDINMVDDIPVVYPRTHDDVEYIIEIANIYNYLADYNNLITKNIYNFPTYVDFNNNIMYTYDGEQYNFNIYVDKIK